MPGLGTPLNRKQWDVVANLTPHVDAWNSVPEVGPAEMGRAAAKIETVESLLRELEAKVSASNFGLRHYGKQSDLSADASSGSGGKGLPEGDLGGGGNYAA